ncbi:MAG TPA: hypothetical protein DF383_00795 [Deltaproteobacteria bacterium]|nr:hypothetical protein [Deltaproteobacteria bacterium]
MRLRTGFLTLLFCALSLGSLSVFAADVWPEKVKVGGEYRLRLESEINYDFDSSVPASDTYLLSRLRVYLDLNPSPHLQLFGMFQDSETIDQGNAVFKTPDQRRLYQAFFVVKSKPGALETRIKGGRQELKYGDERLIGALNWSNLGRSFDGVVLHFETKAFWLDLFGTRIKPQGKEVQFAGGYAQLKKFPTGILEPYVLFLHGNQSGVDNGPLDLVTVGTRVKGKFKKHFDYGFEGAYQSGKSNGNLVSAFALHSEIGVNIPKSFKPRFELEYNFASGDSSPGVGTVTTFNNLFPTNHSKYGYMDLFSWKNLHDLKLGFSAKPVSFFQASVDYHLFFLPQPADGVFAANGRQLRPGIPGASPYAGQEIDFLFTFKPIKHFDALVGYSMFFPGSFFSDTGPSDRAQFFYTQFVAKY